MTTRRRYVTLIEMLIVMVLIVTIGSAIAFGVTKAVKKERLRAGVDVVVDTIQLAQDMMLNLSANTGVVIEEKKSGGFSCAITFDDVMRFPQMKAFIDKASVIPGVSRISFLPDDPSEETMTPPITLHFFSSGSVMSRGNIALIAPSGEERYIYLSGNPEAITSSEEKGTQHYVDDSDDLYPHEIFDDATI